MFFIIIILTWKHYISVYFCKLFARITVKKVIYVLVQHNVTLKLHGKGAKR